MSLFLYGMKGEDLRVLRTASDLNEKATTKALKISIKPNEYGMMAVMPRINASTEMYGTVRNEL